MSSGDQTSAQDVSARSDGRPTAGLAVATDSSAVPGGERSVIPSSNTELPPSERPKGANNIAPADELARPLATAPSSATAIPPNTTAPSSVPPTPGAPHSEIDPARTLVPSMKVEEQEQERKPDLDLSAHEEQDEEKPIVLPEYMLAEQRVRKRKWDERGYGPKEQDAMEKRAMEMHLSLLVDQDETVHASPRAFASYADMIDRLLPWHIWQVHDAELAAPRSSQARIIMERKEGVEAEGLVERIRKVQDRFWKARVKEGGGGEPSSRPSRLLPHVMAQIQASTAETRADLSALQVRLADVHAQLRARQEADRRREAERQRVQDEVERRRRIAAAAEVARRSMAGKTTSATPARPVGTPTTTPTPTTKAGSQAPVGATKSTPAAGAANGERTFLPYTPSPMATARGGLAGSTSTPRTGTAGASSSTSSASAAATPSTPVNTTATGGTSDGTPTGKRARGRPKGSGNANGGGGSGGVGLRETVLTQRQQQQRLQTSASASTSATAAAAPAGSPGTVSSGLSTPSPSGSALGSPAPVGPASAAAVAATTGQTPWPSKHPPVIVIKVKESVLADLVGIGIIVPLNTTPTAEQAAAVPGKVLPLSMEDNLARVQIDLRKCPHGQLKKLAKALDIPVPPDIAGSGSSASASTAVSVPAAPV